MKKIINFLHYVSNSDLFGRRCKIENRGRIINLKKTIYGCCGGGNFMKVGKGSELRNCSLRIVGSKNRIEIGENVYLGDRCSLYLEGNGILVKIGDQCSFSHDDQLCAQEDNMRIIIGNDCMFSHHINVRTSDSHVIKDINTDERLNKPQSVSIGNHVWVAPNSIIMKGVSIGNGSIVGSNSIVTKSIPDNSIAVGCPTKVVKTNVKWLR